MFLFKNNKQSSKDDIKTESKFSAAAYRPSYSLTSGTYRAPKTPVSVTSLLNKYSPLSKTDKEKEEKEKEQKVGNTTNGAKKEDDTKDSQKGKSTSLIKKYGINRETSGSKADLTGKNDTISSISRRNSISEQKGLYLLLARIFKT